MSACIICNSSLFKNYFKGLKQCLHCGHIAADIGMAKIPFKDIYDRSYFEGREYFDYLGDRKCHEKNFRSRLNDLRRYCLKGKLLEIGSAFGLFLNLAKRYYSVIGYEICVEAADYAKARYALDVKTTDFLHDNLPNDSFDALAMWDVLEHLYNPQDFIAKSYQLLKKNGILALTTGDISSFLARQQGAKWRLIHPPTHIHYFTKEGIVQLLGRYNFNVVKISYPGYWRTLRQIFYSLFIHSRPEDLALQGKDERWPLSINPNRPRLLSRGSRRLILRDNPNKLIFNFINSTPLARFPVYLNTFDIMQVIAKK